MYVRSLAFTELIVPPNMNGASGCIGRVRPRVEIVGGISTTLMVDCFARIWEVICQERCIATCRATPSTCLARPGSRKPGRRRTFECESLHSDITHI